MKRVGGVGIMIAASVQLIDIIPANDRILQVLLKINNINISVFNCYAPTEDAKKSKKETFYRVLEKTIKCNPAKYKQIVIGDMNATLGNESYGFWKCLGATNNNLKTNDNGERLLKLAESQKFTVENTIRPSTKGEKRINTWISAKGFEKSLDYVLTSKCVHKYTVKCIVRRGSSKGFDTDHLLIETSLQIPSVKQLKKNNKVKSTRKPQPIVHQLREANIETQYVNTLLNDDIVKKLTTATETVCDMESSNKSKPMWHDEELQELLKKQKKSELRKIMKQIKKKKVELLNKFYEQKAQNINEASEARKMDREFAEAKKHHMHKQSRDLLVSKSTLHCHFESHFKDNDIVPMPPEITNPKDSCLMDTLNIAIEVDESPPTEKEVEGVLAQLKNGKCSGIDNIRMEQMKFGRRSNAFIQHLMKLLFLIWTSAIVPALWMQSKISCVFKK